MLVTVALAKRGSSGRARVCRREGAGRTRCTHRAWSRLLDLVPVREPPIKACSSFVQSEAGQMTASDYVPIFFKNRLHLVGRRQKTTRPRQGRARLWRRTNGVDWDLRADRRLNVEISPALAERRD
jgi:hypothetical protein